MLTVTGVLRMDPESQPEWKSYEKRDFVTFVAVVKETRNPEKNHYYQVSVSCPKDPEIKVRFNSKSIIDMRIGRLSGTKFTKGPKPAYYHTVMASYEDLVFMR